MAIAVTVLSEPPQAELLIDDLPAGTTRVWVYRVGVSRERRVRGDDQQQVVGDTVRVLDYDMPIGRPISYRVRCWAANGADLGSIGPSGSYTVALIDPNEAWLSDPLVPGLARRVVLRAGSDDSRTFSSDTTYAQVIGQAAPVALSSTRSAASGWKFLVAAMDHVEIAAIKQLIAGGGTLLLRFNPTVVWHETGLIYFSSPDVTLNPRRDYRYEPQRGDWELSGREVMPPSISAVAPTQTWQNVIDENDTWTDVVNNYGSWLDLLRGGG